MRYPLELPLRPSCCILTLLVAIHLIAAAAFVFSSLPSMWRVAAPAILLLSVLSSVARERAKSRLVVVLRDDGGIGFAQGRALRVARPLPGIADFGWVVWIRLAAPVGEPPLPAPVRALMLMPDSLPTAHWRALRIWLRHKAAAGTVSDAGAA